MIRTSLICDVCGKEIEPDLIRSKVASQIIFPKAKKSSCLNWYDVCNHCTGKVLEVLGQQSIDRSDVVMPDKAETQTDIASVLFDAHNSIGTKELI